MKMDFCSTIDGVPSLNMIQSSLQLKSV